MYEYNDADVDKWMEAAEKLVLEAGDLIKRSLGKAKAISIKTQLGDEGHSSGVLTETDQAVEIMLIKGLSAQFPDHKFIGEEGLGSTGNEKLADDAFTDYPTWIIDPIDGTMNFVHCNPLVCTSVGLTVNRRLVGGIVNCPMIGHLYTAKKGRGAFVNGNTKLTTSGIKSLNKAMLLMELPTGANDEKKNVAVDNAVTFMERAHAIRNPGPAAMDIAWIGSGSADAFFHFGIHCWDMAAGVLIVNEAGGCALAADGSEFDLMGRQIVAASSEELAREVVANLKHYKVTSEYSVKCPV